MRCATLRLLAAGALAALAGAPLALADVIELKEGAPLEAQVLSEKCRNCAGTGRVACPACKGTGLKGEAKCESCAGEKTGVCPACGGLGSAELKIRARVRAGIVELPRGQVRRIVWRPVDLAKLLPAAEYYRLAAAKLGPQDAQANFDLAVWCTEQGLSAEARKHFAAAIVLDAKLAKSAEPHLAELARRAETEAVKALLAALGTLERKGPEDGVAALRAFQRSCAETELARRAELQRDLVRKHFPALAPEGADSVEQIIRAAEDRIAARCPVCGGLGRRECPDCAGTGAGACPDCAGKGQSLCPVCRGTGRLTCPRCYGSGVSVGVGLGFDINQICPECGGRREVGCDVCGGKGQRPCRRCAGTGRLPGACATCAGKARVACAACGGLGFRPVESFTWGPPPVRGPGVINVGAGGRVRAWQGELAGGVITVLGAETVFRGTLAPVVERATGKKPRLLAIALDNRKGAAALRLRPAERTVRAVTELHEQVEALDLPAELAAGGRDLDAQAKAVAKRAAGQDCLPGAYLCVLAAFPEGTDLDKLSAVFWVPPGTADPVKLLPIWLADDEVAELRRSLR